MIVPPTLFSEPIALVLADQTKAGYLGTQVFTGLSEFWSVSSSIPALTISKFPGLMYTAAALSLLYARTWKIGDMQTQALGKKREDGSDEDDGRASPAPFVKRLLSWQKV